MEKNPMLAANIRALRKSTGMNQSEFAERIGAAQPQISKWERGERPEAPSLAALADLAGVPSSAFLTRPWNPPEVGTSRQAPDQPVTNHVGAGEFVEIIRVDFSYAMGEGRTIDDYIEETSLRFEASYVRSFTRAEPSRLRIASGVGESMLPTLASADMVWVDTTQNRLNQQDRIWAISLYGAGAIKRLRKVAADRVLVISDNPDVPNQEVEMNDMIIHGRVIRFARDL